MYNDHGQATFKLPFCFLLCPPVQASLGQFENNNPISSPSLAHLFVVGHKVRAEPLLELTAQLLKICLVGSWEDYLHSQGQAHVMAMCARQGAGG